MSTDSLAAPRPEAAEPRKVAPPVAAAALRGTATIFFVSGLLSGAWAPQIAFAKERLDLSDALLGALLLIPMAGALLGMAAVSLAATRTGTGPLVRLSAPLAVLLLLAPSLAPSLGVFVVGLLVFGVTLGAIDVSMNGHASLVERLSGRKIMSRLHGWFSLGGFAGAAAATPLIREFGPVGQVGGTVAVGLLLVIAVTIPRLLPGALDRGEKGAPLFAPPGPRTLLFGLIAFLVLMAEGAVLDWSAIWTREALATPEARVAFPYAAFSLGMAAGRFGGDALRERLSASAILTAGGLLWAFGLAFALFAPGFGAVLVGFLVCGLGLATLFPILLALAAERTRRTATEAIAAVASLGYLGLMAGPPIIGLIAEAFSLTAALVLVAGLGLVTAVAGRAAVRGP